MCKAICFLLPPPWHTLQTFPCCSYSEGNSRKNAQPLQRTPLSTPQGSQLLPPPLEHHRTGIWAPSLSLHPPRHCLLLSPAEDEGAQKTSEPQGVLRGAVGYSCLLSSILLTMTFLHFSMPCQTTSLCSWEASLLAFLWQPLPLDVGGQLSPRGLRPLFFVLPQITWREALLA